MKGQARNSAAASSLFFTPPAPFPAALPVSNPCLTHTSQADVDASKKLLLSQVKEFTDYRKTLSTKEDFVPGRKKRLQKLIFPHMMSFGIFEGSNAKVSCQQHQHLNNGNRRGQGIARANSVTASSPIILPSAR